MKPNNHLDLPMLYQWSTCMVLLATDKSNALIAVFYMLVGENQAANSGAEM